MSRPELLSPAGNLEKLNYAYMFGADAVYIGLDRFSLRQKADNFSEADLIQAGKVKGDKKLYCAVNSLFHQEEIGRLAERIPSIAQLPFDAFIVSDLGAARLLKQSIGDKELHLSTQASCLNAEAVKTYRDLGFSRVILGREASIDDIKRIKDAVPDMEIECFVHGAMCLAYSGRCFLSAYLADRSANEGACAHSCRWNWRVLEEGERPGEYYPIIEDKEAGYTTILSSKDLCMIDYVDDLIEAGVDSLKIEGRMKSLYYTAMVTRAYRKAIDHDPRLEDFRRELFRVSHREYCTGFFFPERKEIQSPNTESYQRAYLFLGTLGDEIEPGLFRFSPKNQLRDNDSLEVIGPEEPYYTETAFTIYKAEDRQKCSQADHGKEYLLRLSVPVKSSYILRKKNS